jgi:hypothetical protein
VKTAGLLIDDRDMAARKKSARIHILDRRLRVIENALPVPLPNSATFVV